MWCRVRGVVAVGFLTSGDTPEFNATAQEVIAHYSDEGTILLGILSLVIGAMVFLFFAGILRSALRNSDRVPEWLATVVFGGGAVYSIALAIFAMGQFMLIDAAELGQPEVAQALNVFDNNNFFPAVVGLGTMLLATGWHALRSRLFPVWLGWVSLVLGLLALAGPAGFIAFLLFPIWVFGGQCDALPSEPWRRPREDRPGRRSQVTPPTLAGCATG